MADKRICVTEEAKSIIDVINDINIHTINYDDNKRTKELLDCFNKHNMLILSVRESCWSLLSKMKLKSAHMLITINIPRRSRGFFSDGQSPVLLATPKGVGSVGVAIPPTLKIFLHDDLPLLNAFHFSLLI